MPILTTRALALAMCGLVPAMLAVFARPFVFLAIAFDVALMCLVAFDFVQSKRMRLLVTRAIDDVISSGARQAVRLSFETDPGQRVRGAFREVLPSGDFVIEASQQPFDFVGTLEAAWFFTAKNRGDLKFSDIWVRIDGPLGFCGVRRCVPAARVVKVYPDLRALSRDALSLARASDATTKRVQRVRSEGREFESLREYRAGDDRRSIDWKATARRGRPIVRLHQPERNQTVVLMLDCGRHMAGEVLGRRKLDHAIDAALRLAHVSLGRGDLVGVMAFATKVQVWLPPKKGLEQLKRVAQALYRVEATLEESDYGAALDLAFSRGARRSLVIVLTDLLDADAAAPLVKRALRLVPRHLPLIISMRDDDLHRVASAMPATREGVVERFVATRLENDSKATIAKLRDAGAKVLRPAAADLGPAAVNAYLDIKARGLL